MQKAKASRSVRGLDKGSSMSRASREIVRLYGICAVSESQANGRCALSENCATCNVK